MPPKPPHRPAPASAANDRAITVARVHGRAGELVLRRRGPHFEMICNGIFLMDTRDGRSERLLVRAALGRGPTTASRVLIAGLGVGFSLAEALGCTAVEHVTVLERESAVVSWNREVTGDLTGGSVADSRVRCEVVDVVDWLRRPAPETFDVVCLDVDNGPHWTVSATNGWLYSDQGIAALRGRLRAGGALSVWSSAAVPTFERRLARQFRQVARHEVAVPRGEPDVVYVADG